MKAICKVMKTPGNVTALLRYLYRQRKSDAGKKSEVLAIVLGSRGGKILLVGDYAADALALAARKGRAGSGVRHVVISAEGESSDVVQKLKLAARDWVAAYAPGRAWVAVVHTSARGHPHVHIAVEHRGDDKRGLKWSRKDVRSMCGMKFTTQFEGTYAPGQARSRERSKLYPHAADTDALELVKLIVAAGTSVDSYVTATGIGLGIVDANGVPYSVIFHGRRLRVSTLRRLHRTELLRRRDEQRAIAAMLTTPFPALPKVGGILAELDDVANCMNKPRGMAL